VGPRLNCWPTGRHPPPHGAIAQLGERLDRTQEVGGSSPPSSIITTESPGDGRVSNEAGLCITTVVFARKAKLGRFLAGTPGSLRVIRRQPSRVPRFGLQHLDEGGKPESRSWDGKGEALGHLSFPSARRKRAPMTDRRKHDSRSSTLSAEPETSSDRPKLAARLGRKQNEHAPCNSAQAREPRS
jgi:hypothetical protein